MISQAIPFNGVPIPLCVAIAFLLVIWLYLPDWDEEDGDT